MQEVETVELEQKANIRTKEKLESSVKEKQELSEVQKKDLEIVSNAIAILRQISDEAVQQSYGFITENINAALERIFQKTKRQIRLKEYTRGGMYPQLEIELTVENGVVRSLKDDSGHGIMQIVSLLCILSVIAITGNRRILVLDEALSGLSDNSREVIDEVLWSFTQIGFQFILSEHGYIPKGAKVYKLESENGISNVVDEYIQEEGYYLGPKGRNAKQKSELSDEYTDDNSISDSFKSGAVVSI